MGTLHRHILSSTLSNTYSHIHKSFLHNTSPQMSSYDTLNMSRSNSFVINLVIYLVKPTFTSKHISETEARWVLFNLLLKRSISAENIIIVPIHVCVCLPVPPPLLSLSCPLCHSRSSLKDVFSSPLLHCAHSYSNVGSFFTNSINIKSFT